MTIYSDLVTTPASRMHRLFIDDVEYAVRHFPDFATANAIDEKFDDEIGEYLKNRVLVQ